MEEQRKVKMSRMTNEHKREMSKLEDEMNDERKTMKKERKSYDTKIMDLNNTVSNNEILK